MAREQRKLAAILAADIVGYSRLMGRDESGTLARLRRVRAERLEPVLARHGGRVVKLAGDGALIEFASAVEALAAAIEFQQTMTTGEANTAEIDRVVFRIGLHLGDLIVDGDDLYGDSVNVAARLEAQASPGGILVSGAVHDATAGRLATAFDDLGRLALKNIERSVQAYAVRWEASDWPITVPAATEPVTGAAAAPSLATALPLPDKPSIAVLPFRNMNGDPEQEYFADGMVEEIITALSRIKSLFVIARNSSFAYKGKSPDIRDVGRALGVRYVLEGSVRKAGDRVRLTGQLIDAVSGIHLWADRFDGALDDVFDLQDRMTGSVVAAIEPKLRMAEIARAQRKPTESLQAYDLMLRSQSHARSMTRENLNEAIRLLRRTIHVDAAYAMAFVHLARCSWYTVAQGWKGRTDPTVIDMVDLARTGLALDGEDPEVLTTVAPVIALPGGDLDGGLALLDKAINRNPNSAEAFRTAGLLHAYACDAKAAIDSLARADRLNPLDAGTYHSLGYTLAHFVAGRHDMVIDRTGQMLQERPNNAPALRYRIASFGLLDRVEEGRQAVHRLIALIPDFTIARARQHIEFDMNNVFKVRAIANSFYEGLRRSGVPER